MNNGAKLEAQGSSPRVRGTPVQYGDEGFSFGIIPACAGNTRSERRTTRAARDHPRVCGEHCLIVLTILIGWGSSPRVRGTLTVATSTPLLQGIIPACAGNTIDLGRGWVDVGDHPRVCGEHPSSIAFSVCGMGSSPRVRGTRNVQKLAMHDVGIIPACAGNTVNVIIQAQTTGDHPRVCGEHVVDYLAVFIKLGSSPRVRGTHGHSD